LVRVVLGAGAGRARVEKFFVRVTQCWAKARELNQLKNRKTRGCTVLEQCCHSVMKKNPRIYLEKKTENNKKTGIQNA